MKKILIIFSLVLAMSAVQAAAGVAIHSNGSVAVSAHCDELETSAAGTGAEIGLSSDCETSRDCSMKHVCCSQNSTILTLENFQPGSTGESYLTGYFVNAAETLLEVPQPPPKSV